MQIVKPTYRSLEGLNQSMLKIFDSDPIKFYREFVLKEIKEDNSSPAMLLGDLVDFYLLECRGNSVEFDSRFDEKYVLFNGNRSSSQVFDLADELFKVTKLNMTEEGEIVTQFETRFKEAFVNIQANGKYKGKTWEKGLEDFTANGMDYFQSLMKSIGKKVVDLGLIERAKVITEQLLTDDFTKDIFNNEELVTKQIIEFEWHGFKCKSEVDCFLINHENKTIQPFDLKITWDNESFDYMYIKNSYYLQQAFYDCALEEYCIQNNISDYTILPFCFIVGDSSKNSRRPLVYKLTAKHTEQGYNGFTFNNRYYRGINELIKAIEWANFNQIWNCSKENFENNGIVELQEFK